MFKTFILTFLLIVADQVTKFQADKLITEPIKIFDNYLVLTKIENPGIAFGLELPKVLLITITVVLIAVIIHLIYREINLKHKISILASSLILGGAIGNLIDRVMAGSVIDFISIKYWPTFNLADIFIVTGVILVIVFNKKIIPRKG